MHAPYVGKHYDAWKRAINKLVEAMPNIEHVEVSLRVKEAPLAFTFREPWAEMVLQLRRLKHLKSATVSLWSPKVKKHWSWDDPSVELQSPTWVKLATGLHDAFANALALRMLGKSERKAVWKYRLLVDKGLAAKKEACCFIDGCWGLCGWMRRSTGGGLQRSECGQRDGNGSARKRSRTIAGSEIRWTSSPIDD